MASTRLADWSAKRVVKAYRQRMQIELSFRDMKSQHFGEGLECSRYKDARASPRLAHLYSDPLLSGPYWLSLTI